MPTIEVRRSHVLPKEEARKRAEDLARSLEQKLGLEWRWEGDRIVFGASGGVAKGTQGAVHVGEKEVRVEIDLPLLLRVMKGKVESKVQEKLDKLLPA
jgi:putative polyhydroxyalkanoate system protein